MRRLPLYAASLSGPARLPLCGRSRRVAPPPSPCVAPVTRAAPVARHPHRSKTGNSNTFSVSMSEGAVRVSGVQFPLDARGEFVMEILYIDNKIRISRLNQHELVHLRIANRT